MSRVVCVSINTPYKKCRGTEYHGESPPEFSFGAVLCCTVLLCAALYSFVPYSTLGYATLLCSTLPYSTTLRMLYLVYCIWYTVSGTWYTVVPILVFDLSGGFAQVLAVLCFPLFSYAGVVGTASGMVDLKDLKPLINRLRPSCRSLMVSHSIGQCMGRCMSHCVSLCE